MKSFVLVLGALAVVQCSPTPISKDENVLKNVIGGISECVNSDVDVCLKEHALKAAERISSSRKLKIIEGISILNSAPRESRSYEALSDVPDVRSKQLTERLWKTSGDLLQGGEIELTYGGSDEEEEESRAIGDVEESRGKKKKLKKKLKILIPLLMIAKAKAIAIALLALIIIAASVLKIAIIAKVAFILKVIAVIKALLAAKKHLGGHEETWEIQPAHGWESPHSSHGHVEHIEHGHGWGGGESGWSRRGNDGNSLAYSAYNN